MNAPSRAALVALVALVALGGLFVLGLYALTVPEQRPELLGKLTPALAAAVAGVPGFLAWLSAGKLRAEHAATQADVQRVVVQTNGSLDERMRQANDELAQHLLTQLGAQRRRSTDDVRGRRHDDGGDDGGGDDFPPVYSSAGAAELAPQHGVVGP